MIILKDIDAHHPLTAAIEKIYTPSFPDNERIPFERLLPTLSDIRILSAVFDDDTLIGMTTVFLFEDIVYLAYLAIDPVQRGKGYGTAVLEALRLKYHDYRFIIDIEQQDPAADNAEERRKRRDFYLRAGYEDTGVRYFFYGVHYDLFSLGGKVKASEYKALIRKHWGRIAKTAVFTEVTL